MTRPATAHRSNPTAQLVFDLPQLTEWRDAIYARIADHALRTAALEPLTLTVTARAAWAAATAVTLDEGTRAATELTRRGMTPGTEPDRTTTPDWLNAHHQDPDADTAEASAERAANRARAITAAH